MALSGSSDQGNRGRIPEPALIQWLRSLADLVDAGVPLVQGLETLGRSRATRDFSMAVTRYVQAGLPFSVALSGRTPAIVPAMVRAGEASGRLPEALRGAAGFLDARRRAIQALRQELGMPLATAIYTSIVLVFAAGFVVPRFVRLYERIGVNPPALTQAVVALNQLVRNHWAILLVLVLFGMIAVEHWLSRLEVVRRSHLGIFYWALGALLGSGVPIVEALELSGSASGMEPISRSATLAARDIAEGADLVATMRRHDLLPTDLLVLFSGGAASGRLPEVLGSMSSLLSQQVAGTVGRAARWLGGTAVVMVGAAVLVLGVSVYVPIVNLALSALGKVLVPGR